ncbi:MAG: FliM/FliN family flagellar motor switch protein [Treponema sp.]|nr:FliM/FliN family flagellar motor switch protein [Treponema sp.]
MKKFVSSSNAWYNTGMGAVSISQDELNKVLNNIRKDNDEREKIPDSPGIALSQSELEKLFGSSQSLAPKSDSTAGGNSGTSSVTETELQSDAERDAAREAKIAERKARAAAILAQANASSPKRISVVYGTATRRGHEVEKLQPGDTIQLDRIIPEYADILVDGKLFARGIIKDQNGHASVTIAQLVE